VGALGGREFVRPGREGLRCAGGGERDQIPEVELVETIGIQPGQTPTNQLSHRNPAYSVTGCNAEITRTTPGP